MSEETKPKNGHPFHPMYMVTIHHAAASGDLTEMKKVAAEAEEHVRTHGDVSAALQVLRTEIAKLEAK